MGDIHVEWFAQEPPGIPTAFWRGVGVTRGTFPVESFIDELAAAAKQDPLAYRLALLEKSPRSRAVLQLAADKAGWEKPLPRGQGRGLSLCTGFGSFIAQVVEVSVDKDGTVKPTRAVCVVDCGHMVNPDTVRTQMESGIIFGLSAVLYGEITLKEGRVEQTNFGDYRVLRISESPQIEVHLIKSAEAPGGIGEPGTSVCDACTDQRRVCGNRQADTQAARRRATAFGLRASTALRFPNNALTPEENMP